MSIDELLADLRQRGATVQVLAGRVRIQGPPGTDSPELRDAVSRHKDEILDSLGCAQTPASHPIRIGAGSRKAVTFTWIGSGTSVPAQPTESTAPLHQLHIKTVSEDRINAVISTGLSEGPDAPSVSASKVYSVRDTHKNEELGK